jgi:hypothetical protein
LRWQLAVHANENGDSDLVIDFLQVLLSCWLSLADHFVVGSIHAVARRARE